MGDSDPSGFTTLGKHHTIHQQPDPQQIPSSLVSVSNTGTEPFHAQQGSLLLPKNTRCIPKERLTQHWTGRDLHRKVLQEGKTWVMILGNSYSPGVSSQVRTSITPQWGRDPVRSQPGLHSPGMLEMQSTWALQTVNWSTTVPGWLASIITTLLVDSVLVRIQTRLDVASVSWSSFAFGRADTQGHDQHFSWINLSLTVLGNT